MDTKGDRDGVEDERALQWLHSSRFKLFKRLVMYKKVVRVDPDT